MPIEPTKQLSKEATEALLKDFHNPTVTPEMQAQFIKVREMAKRIKKRINAKKSTIKQ